STSSPKKPKIGQAPIMRKTDPTVRLTPPSTIITTMKPERDSERCGLSLAVKSVGSSGNRVASSMPRQYRRGMGRKQAKSAPKKKARTAAPRAKAAPRPKAAKGMKPWTAAEVEEAFHRFKTANPEPRGELEHVNAYTLLVAVVLSAQATDT